MLVAVSASPLYTAVIEFAPTGILAFVNIAIPLALNVAVPSEVVSFLKVTKPVGALGAVDVTVAVKVTDCP
jgi:hypothetical protein